MTTELAIHLKKGLTKTDLQTRLGPNHKIWIGEPEPDTGSVSKRSTKSIFIVSKKYLLHSRYPKIGSPNQIQSQKLVPMTPIQDRPNLCDEATHVDTAEIAVDGIPKVLAEESHHGADEVDESAALVEELEVPVVDVDLVYGEVAHQVRQEMLGHGSLSLSLSLSHPTTT